MRILTRKLMPMAKAKARLAECVDHVAHSRSAAVIILRHGRPVAALVHPSMAEDALDVSSTEAGRMTMAEAKAFIDSFKGLGDPNISAVDDVRAGRR